MENKKLEILHSLLKELQEEQKTDYYLQDIKRVLALTETKKMVESCKRMLEYMEHTYSTSAETEEEKQEFFNMDFIIQFGCESVTIPNNADTFDMVQTLLEDVVKDYSGY